MGTHLVLTVHGIGEQVAGETVDDFANAARHELALTARVEHTDVWLPHVPAGAGARRREHDLRLFPCAQRRIAAPGRDLLFAEVHWSDLSKAPEGRLRTIVDLLRMVLGLGYLALENVENNSDAESPAAKLAVRTFARLLYGVFAPLQLFLLIAATLLLGVGFIETWLGEIGFGWTSALIGIATVYGAVFLKPRTTTYILSTVPFGVMMLGVALFWYAILQSVFGPFDPSCGLLGACAETGGLSPSCLAALSIVALDAVWIALFLCLIWMGVAGGWRMFVDFGHTRTIYLGVCSGVLLIWTALTASLWSLYGQTVSNLPVPGSAQAVARLIAAGLADATETLPATLIALGLLVVLIVFLFLRRRVLASKLGLTPGVAGPYDRAYGRALLNCWANAFFVAAILFVLIFAVTVLLGIDLFGLFGLGFLTEWLPIVVPVAAASIGVALFQGSGSVGAALGVGRDIVVYAARSELTNPRAPNSASHYPYREDIEGRFLTVLDALLAQEGVEKVTRITIVSHSQGTVIAHRGLGLATLPMPVALVTMGCPLSHIYSHYFAQTYPLTTAPERVASWINIYRTDDFVGTWVWQDGSDVTNRPVGLGGHSNYWTDRRVWEELRKAELFD